MATAFKRAAMFKLPNFDAMYRDMGAICGDQVWCKKCGFTKRVDATECLRHGWPKCCGHTMTIDKSKSPPSELLKEKQP